MDPSKKPQRDTIGQKIRTKNIVKHVLWVSNDKVNFTTQYSYIAV